MHNSVLTVKNPDEVRPDGMIWNALKMCYPIDERLCNVVNNEKNFCQKWQHDEVACKAQNN